MKRPCAPASNRGFAAIAAIFIVVLLAALGAFMLRFSNTQHLSNAQDIQGTRAFWAARAGLEWGLGSINASPGACPAASSTRSIEGFSVVVACSLASYTEAGAPVNVYSLTATASRGGSAGSLAYVERSVSVRYER